MIKALLFTRKYPKAIIQRRSPNKTIKMVIQMIQIKMIKMVIKIIAKISKDQRNHQVIKNYSNKINNTKPLCKSYDRSSQFMIDFKY